MKQLKFKFDLDCRVAIYVPSTVNVNEPTDNKAQVLNTIKRLSELFGGATASEAVGGWVSQAGETVLERVTIVYAFCTSDQLHKHFNDVYGIAVGIRDEMKQEAVTLEVNGQVKFV